MPEKQSSRVSLPYLQAWRINHLLTLRQLSEASGVSITTIHSLEHTRAQANMVTVAKLARGLGISRDVLVNQEPQEQVETKDAA